MKNKKTIAIFIVLCAVISLILCSGVSAADLDEIVGYEITVDVNEDATLTMVYMIDWKVLDSTSEGPLSWVQVGIPNNHYVSYRPLTETIDDISFSSSSGGFTSGLSSGLVF